MNLKDDILAAFASGNILPVQEAYCYFRNDKCYACAVGALFFNKNHLKEQYFVMRDYVRKIYKVSLSYVQGIEQGWDDEWSDFHNNYSPDYAKGFALGKELWEEVNE